MNEILDITVIVLLAIAILYGIRLNRKVKLIHDSRKELANLFRSFDNTILNAQTGIDDLRKASEGVSASLQQQIDRAELLLDDLSFVSERSTQLANRMEALISSSREMIKLSNDNMPSPAVMRQVKAADRGGNDDGKREALQALLEKIAENKNNDAAENGAKANNDGFTKKIFRKTAPKPGKTVSKDASREELVAGALRALGYGTDK